MPEQRRRWGGRMTDLDRMTPEEIDAEEAGDALREADAIDDPVLRGEEEPGRLDHSYSRGGSYWPGSWGGA